MSGAIRDMEKIHSRQMDTLRRKNEREMKFVENSHEDVRAEVKKNQEAEMVQLQHEHRKQLVAENEKKEKLLEGMRSHLQQSKDLTERELRELKTNSEKDNHAIKEKMGLDRENAIAQHEMYLEDINSRFNRSIRKVNEFGRERVDSLKAAKHHEYKDKEEELERKLNHQTEQFTTRFREDGKKYQSIKDQQDSAFKKERLNTNVRQSHQLEKMTTQHQHSAEMRDRLFRQDIRSQDIFHEKRFTETMKSREADYQKLDELNKKIINKTKSDLAQEIQLYTNRAQDPFFQFSELRPSMKELEDGVEVRVKVPEHSKTDLMLTLNKKEVILNFNRRYSDAIDTAEGVHNRVNKVETLTTRMKSHHHLDPKSVKSHYADGVMTYHIKKA